MAGCVGEHEKCAGGDHHGADSESVEAVGQVHGIARGDDDEGSQGDVEDSDVWREILEEGHGELRVEGGAVVDGHGDAEGHDHLPGDLHASGDAVAIAFGDLVVVVYEAEYAVSGR